MRNIKLHIEYDGTNYSGWQVQKKLKTIQSTIENALRKILQEKIRLIVSGRTDTGVHAQDQVANFSTQSKITLLKLRPALNSNLPLDITITKVEGVKRDFHSRFSVKSKIYRYTILNRPYRSSFLRNRVYFYPYHLDVGLMQKEARSLLGRHDFTAFRASGSSSKDAFKTIKRLKVARDKDFIYIDIEADGFLYNMARGIVGTLIDVGRGKLSCGSLKKILLSKNRRLTGQTAPARGLCLVKVNY
ncbi:MAG: tRNA pseudouridine(38-40) synthase TruA [Omnitrophica WOR_2 bacterium RBG_13_41_10]|nr:MAG: tRNA pseudouridine(38-40) synthase TruA [Omnitrophica WOR_2 bacterium RBG_13_41_10]